jgi:hypothetical protein
MRSSAKSIDNYVCFAQMIVDTQIIILYKL